MLQGRRDGSAVSTITSSDGPIDALIEVWNKTHTAVWKWQRASLPAAPQRKTQGVISNAIHRCHWTSFGVF